MFDRTAASQKALTEKNAIAGDTSAMLALAGLAASMSGNDGDTDAVAWTIKAAQLRDPVALRALGFIGSRLPGEESLVRLSQELLCCAASLGDQVALRFTNPRTMSDPAQLDALPDYAPQFLRAFVKFREKPAASIEEVCAEPRIAVASALLTPSECEYVQTVATPQLDGARIFSSKVKQNIVDADVRAADAASLRPEQLDLVTAGIARRVANHVGRNLSSSDYAQVVRYRPGGKFLAHMDTSEEESLAVTGKPRRRREISFIAYLNDNYVGGETAFVKPRLKVSGGMGDAIHFHNLKPSGELDRSTLHAGIPVTEGEKWIWVQWFRESDVDGDVGFVESDAATQSGTLFVQERTFIRGLYGRTGRYMREGCWDWDNRAAKSDYFSTRALERSYETIFNEQASLAQTRSASR